MVILSRPHLPRLNPLDDAYMFWRYAMHARSGLGISWNLNGVPTYGPTSLTWLIVVLLLSFICTKPALLLVGASWGFAVLATLVIADTVARAAQGPLRRLVYSVPLVALPLFGKSQFRANAGNGLDTMLGVLLAALAVREALHLAGIPSNLESSTGSGGRLGVLAFFAFFTRPETTPCVFLVPLLLWLFGVGRFANDRSLRRIAPVFLWGGVLIATGMACAWAYFKTPLPLSFYIKSDRGYAGYAQYWSPREGMFAFFSTAQVFLATALLTARRQHFRFLCAFWIPVALCFMYLAGVLQIMGNSGRYYMPFLPYIIIPTILVLDEVLRDAFRFSREIAFRGAAALLILWLGTFHVVPELLAADTARHRASLLIYPAPQLEDGIGCALPAMSYDDALRHFSDDLMRVLPAGATVASSEVGYPGARNPDINIIDEVGLNDQEIAQHGFSVDALLDRKPDLIWVPPSDYTYIDGKLLGSPRLYREYTVFAGALEFGIAIRKNDPAYVDLQRALAPLYPHENLASYEITHARWTPTLAPAGSQKEHNVCGSDRHHESSSQR